MSREDIIERLSEEQGRWIGDLFRENERLRDALMAITGDVEAALEEGMLPHGDYIDGRVAECWVALGGRE